MPLKETSEEGYSVYRDPDTHVPKVYVMEVAFRQERDQSHLQSIAGGPPSFLTSRSRCWTSTAIAIRTPSLR